MIGAELLRFDENQQYCLFDCETFNLNLLVENPPWQHSWLIANKREVIDSQDHFINWKGRFRMSRDAARITNYSEEKVSLIGKDPLEVWNLFEPALLNEDIIFCGHNVLNFDFHIINQWARYLGKAPIKNTNRVLDTNCLAKMMKLGIKPDKDNLLQQQYKLAGHRVKGLKTSLGVLAKEFGIAVDDKRLHNAIYDLEINFKVMQKLLWAIEV